MRANLFTRTLLLTALAALAGCGSEQQATEPSVAFLKAPPPPPRETTTSTGTQAVVAVCGRQPYASTTRIVGAAGGSLKAGGNEFKIPAGALTSSVRITMEAVYDSVRSVRFSPEGLVFDAAHLPILRLSYKGCKIPKGVKTKVAYVAESLRIIDVLRTRDDTLNVNVDSQLEHFSRYAVAW